MVLNPAMRWAGRFHTWVDLGSGTAAATKTVVKPKNIKRVSVDIYDGPDKPEGFVNADIVDYVREYSLSGCFVSLLDVIEHFPKQEGIQFLELVESKAAAVCVFTPDGFYQQGPDTHPETAGRPEQWHRSGWTAEEFRNRGYDVIDFPQMHSSFGGFAAIWGKNWRNRILWRISLFLLHLRGLFDYYQRRLHLKK
jgi:hypothetical protein